MTDVIKLLYEAQCRSNSEPTEELAELYHKEHELFDKIHTVLGLRALDELNYTQAQIGHILELDWFRKGFLLGASLMLELL